MLINAYDLEVFTPPCEPGAERFSAVARPTTDITGILPYLNATLRGAVYNPAANALTWKKGEHNIAFHAYEIATSNVEDREAATREIEGLVKLVNRTWERRADLIFLCAQAGRFAKEDHRLPVADRACVYRQAGHAPGHRHRRASDRLALA